MNKFFYVFSLDISSRSKEKIMCNIIHHIVKLHRLLNRGLGGCLVENVFHELSIVTNTSRLVTIYYDSMITLTYAKDPKYRGPTKCVVIRHHCFLIIQNSNIDVFDGYPKSVPNWGRWTQPHRHYQTSFYTRHSWVGRSVLRAHVQSHHGCRSLLRSSWITIYMMLKNTTYTHFEELYLNMCFIIYMFD